MGGCIYDYNVSLSPNLWIMTFDLDLDLDLGLTIIQLLWLLKGLIDLIWLWAWQYENFKIKILFYQEYWSWHWIQFALLCQHLTSCYWTGSWIRVSSFYWRTCTWTMLSLPAEWPVSTGDNKGSQILSFDILLCCQDGQPGQVCDEVLRDSVLWSSQVGGVVVSVRDGGHQTYLQWRSRGSGECHHRLHPELVDT